MTADDQSAARVTQWARRLRIISTVVLLVGVAIAGAVYALGTGPVESNDPATIAQDKIDSRQVEQMYGNVGLLERDWANDLKQPATQAVIIVVITAVVSGGGLFVAWFLDQRHRHSPEAVR